MQEVEPVPVLVEVRRDRRGVERSAFPQLTPGVGVGGVGVAASQGCQHQAQYGEVLRGQFSGQRDTLLRPREDLVQRQLDDHARVQPGPDPRFSREVEGWCTHGRSSRTAVSPWSRS